MAEENLRVLGLDVGARRIGVAISDPTGLLTTPIPAINRRNIKWDLQNVLSLTDKYEVAAIVVGIPISLNGRSNQQAEVVKEFCHSLEAVSSVPVYLEDERFSTKEAERLLREAGHSPSRERGLVDSASAAVILQSYLDSRK